MASKMMGDTSLHLAANNGSAMDVHNLLIAGADVNAKNNKGTAPLHLSAAKGHLDVLMLLLEAKAEINATNKFTDTSLHLAARNGHCNVVKKLLEFEADINATNEDTNTPLHLAAMKGHLHVLMELLEARADINAKNSFADTSLHLAARNGHRSIVKKLLEFDGDINVKNKGANTPLHLTAMKGHLDVLMELLEARADINATNRLTDTSLHLAARNGHCNVVKKLLKCDADINAKNKDTNTPLHLTAMKGHLDVLMVLLKAKADISATNNFTDTSLHLAAKNGHDDIVKKLLEYKADINAENDDKNTSLHLAAMKGHFDVLKELLDSGADISLSNDYTNTSLHLAALNGHADIVNELFNVGADISAKNDYANMPLHLAAINGDVTVVRSLLDAKADATAKNDFSNTSLHLAAANGHANVVRELLEAVGGDKLELLNAKNNDESIALHFAAGKGHVDTLKELVKYGSDINVTNRFEATPLCCAILSNSIDAVKELVRAGANIDKYDNHYQTLVHFAVDLSSCEMVKYLVEELGYKPEDETEEELTALYLSEYRGKADTSWWLKKRQARPKDKDTSKKQLEQTWKHIDDEYKRIEACVKSSRHNQIGRRFLKVCDGHLQDADGMTVLHWTAKYGQVNVVRKLIKHCGMYPFVKTYEGKTPADLAKEEGHLDVLKALRNLIPPEIEGTKEELYEKLLRLINKGDDVESARDLLWAGAPLTAVGTIPYEALTLAADWSRPKIFSLLVASGAPLTISTDNLSLLNMTFRNPDITMRIKAYILRVYLHVLIHECQRIRDNRELIDGIKRMFKLSESPIVLEEILKKLQIDKGGFKISKLKWKTCDSENTSKLLTEAARNDCPLVCSLLYQAGGKTYFGCDDESPVTVAIKNRHWKTLKALVCNMGASVYAHDSGGRLSLQEEPSEEVQEIEEKTYDKERRQLEHICETIKNVMEKQIVKEVLRLQKDLFKFYRNNNHQETLNSFPPELSAVGLLIAAQRGLSQLIFLLIKVGGRDVDSVIDAATGTTSLHQAASHGKGECVNLLLSLGADSCQTDNYKHTALHLAAMFGHKGVYDLLCQSKEHKDCSCSALTAPEKVWSGFEHYLGLYNKCGQDSGKFKKISRCADSSEATETLLNCLKWEMLLSEVDKINIDFTKGEAKDVKEAVLTELRILCSRIEAVNNTYKGELELLGSSSDGTKLYAPDEFDCNLILDQKLLNKIEVVTQKKGNSLFEEEKVFRVETNNPNLKENKLLTTFYDLIEKCLKDQRLAHNQLSLVPPGVTRTQVGVALNMAWQGEKYPLLLIGVDLVPVLKAPWIEEVPKPPLTPKDLNTFYISNTTDGSWRCSFAGAESKVLQQLPPELRRVYIIGKLLLNCMKPEPWMSRSRKNMYTWWNIKRWKIPVPSTFALKNAFFKCLQEKPLTTTEWTEQQLLQWVTQVFGNMCRNFEPLSGDIASIQHDQIHAYFGGDFEPPKTCVGAPEIVQYLFKLTEKHDMPVAMDIIEGVQPGTNVDLPGESNGTLPRKFLKISSDTASLAF